MKIFGNTQIVLFAIAVVVGAAFASGSYGPAAIGNGSLPAKRMTDGRTLKRDFNFNAFIDADGKVNGNAVLVNPEFDGDEPGVPYQLKMEISCMNVVGNVVFLGGMTQSTNDSNLIDAAYFSVKNDEQGDTISQVYFFDDDPYTMGSPQLCMGNQLGDFPMERIETGDIDIRK